MSQKILWRRLLPGEIIEEGDFWIYGGNPNTPPLAAESDELTIEIVASDDPYVGYPISAIGSGQNYYWRPIALTNTENFIHSTIKQKQ